MKLTKLQLKRLIREAIESELGDLDQRICKTHESEEWPRELEHLITHYHGLYISETTAPEEKQELIERFEKYAEIFKVYAQNFEKYAKEWRGETGDTEEEY